MGVDLLAALSGLGFGLSLIVAIGAQNAFVLRQGIRGEHIAVVVAICAVSDAVLITLGVAGAGAVIEGMPELADGVRIAGAAFLFGYAALAARRVWRPSALHASGEDAAGVRAVALAALALTWLNPHVYLDTVLLVGSIASTHGPSGRWWFAAGAGIASIGWFTALGFGARGLTPLFRRPNAWRVLDGGIAVVMFTLAASLIIGM